MPNLDDLATRVAAADGLDEAVDLLVRDLASRIKATSNDQNIQRLARDLDASRAALVDAIAGKRATAVAG